MLKILYSLKERLELSALANINLLEQDFKLKAVLEQLEKIDNPVFKKIYAQTQGVLASENKAVDLLDLLALIDAVLLTQLPTIKDQEITLPTVYKTECLRINSKILESFYQSIYNSGGGRLNVLETILDDPKIIKDFRIFRGVYHGLEDSYSEIRELMAEKLGQCDKTIIPILKADILDGEALTSGKVAKAEIVAKITKNRETGVEDQFIKDLMASTKKDDYNTRLLSCLQLCPDNAELYLNIIKKISRASSEKINMANVALTEIDSKHGTDYMEIYAELLKAGTKMEKVDGKEVHSRVELPRNIFFNNPHTSVTKYLTDFLIESIAADKSIKSTPQEVRNSRFTLLTLGARCEYSKWEDLFINAISGKKPLFKNSTLGLKKGIDITKELSTLFAHKLIWGNHTKDFVKKAVKADGKLQFYVDFVDDIKNMPAGELYDKYIEHTENEDYVDTIINVIYTFAVDKGTYDSYGFDQTYVDFQKNYKPYQPIDQRWVVYLVNNERGDNFGMYSSHYTNVSVNGYMAVYYYNTSTKVIQNRFLDLFYRIIDPTTITDETAEGIAPKIQEILGAARYFNSREQRLLDLCKQYFVVVEEEK